MTGLTGKRGADQPQCLAWPLGRLAAVWTEDSTIGAANQNVLLRPLESSLLPGGAYFYRLHPSGNSAHR